MKLGAGLDAGLKVVLLCPYATALVMAALLKKEMMLLFSYRPTFNLNGVGQIYKVHPLLVTLYPQNSLSYDLTIISILRLEYCILQ